MCGGTPDTTRSWTPKAGLSPRVRGNRLLPYAGVRKHRSIPACAGEPSAAHRSVRATGVYPRVCGGTGRIAHNQNRVKGLSPRVRGNLPHRAAGTIRQGSIPACAGEPRVCCTQARTQKVYPRVCGGTLPCGPPSTSTAGLSPRVRGNRVATIIALGLVRSILACAGEPAGPPSLSPATRVYPRVCGGTPSPLAIRWQSPGLSPRVQGNLPHRAAGTIRQGSIPACAGEPYRRGMQSPSGQVYPRVCGGTRPERHDAPAGRGLSPRVRGNRGMLQVLPAAHRSIPACAGEPHLGGKTLVPTRVYPRVCGGTSDRG